MGTKDSPKAVCGLVGFLGVFIIHMFPYHSFSVSSGAQIKIAGNEGDSPDRLVTITGTPEAVGVAQYLISSRYVFYLMHTENQ